MHNGNSSSPQVTRRNLQSRNNLLSYCGLVDARISASEKNLPVPSPTYLALELFISIWFLVFRSFVDMISTPGHDMPAANWAFRGLPNHDFSTQELESLFTIEKIKLKIN